MTYKLTVTTLALTAITSTVAATHTKPDTEHPHIVLILCDDMGFSDLSCYGGEIHTPNIDYLLNSETHTILENFFTFKERFKQTKSSKNER